MPFAYFFLIGTSLMLVATLFLLRRRDARLRTFGIASSLTALVLLAGALLRLADPDAGSELRRLIDTITVANLSATAVLLIIWTARLRSS